MAISVVWTNSAQNTTQNTTAVTLTLPSGIQDGDIAYVVFSYVNTSGSNATDPAVTGWTMVQKVDIGDGYGALFAKTLTTADSSTTHTFGMATTNKKSVSGIVIRGASVGDTQSWASVSANTASTIPAGTGSGTSESLAFFATEDSYNPNTLSGWTSLTESAAGGTAVARTEIWQGTTGDVSSGSVTSAGSGSKGVWRLVLEPAVVVTNLTYDASTPTSTIDVVAPSFYGPEFGVTYDAATATATTQANVPTSEVTFGRYTNLDQYINEYFSTTANSTDAIYFVGNAAGSSVNARILMDFDMTGIAAVGSANLRININSEAAGTGVLRIKAITSEWTTGTTTDPSVSAAYVDVSGTGIKNVDVASLLTDPANFYGFYLYSPTNRSYTVHSLNTSSSANRPFLTMNLSDVGATLDVTTVTVSLTANDATPEINNPVSVTLDVSTVTATIQANDATPVIIDPINIEVTLSTVTATVQAADASFEEIRTAVLYPTSDAHRLQGTETWVNNTSYLEINYSATANSSSVFVPVGTTAEKAVINNVLERCDFPLELLQPAILAATGQNYVPISFGELDGEGGVGVLGEFNRSTVGIILDNSLNSSSELIQEIAVGPVLLHEIAHAVDSYYLTNSMRVTIWNAMHPGTTNDLPEGTTVTNGVNLKNGEGWKNYGDYYSWVGEAYANAFVGAYSDYHPITNQFDLPATNAVCDDLRATLTPTMSATRGPFPVRTACARMNFDPLPAALVTGVVQNATLRLDTIFNSLGGNFNVRTMQHSGRIADVSDYVVTTLPSGINNVDITSVFDAKAFDTIHVGPMKEGSDRLLRMASMDGGNTSIEPRLTIRYAVAQGATVVDVTTATISDGLGEDITVSATISPDVFVDVSTAVATTNALDATVVLQAVVDVSNTDTVLLGAYDPDIELNNNVVMVMDSVRTFYRANTPASAGINDEPVLPTEDEDPYFVTTMSTIDGGTQRVFGGGYAGVPVGLSEWFRMDKLVNGVFLDRAINTQDPNFSGQAVLQPSPGVTVGLHEGPEARHNVHFNGGAWATVGGASDVDLPTEANVEFTLRTERSTQFLMGGMARNLIGGDTGGFVPAELWMVDGYLEARYWPRIGGTYLDRPPVTMRGTTKLDDGNWHHVVFQTAWQNIVGLTQNSPDRGFASEIFVDGRLDVRRRSGPVPVMRVAKVGGRDEDYYYVSTGTYPMPDVPQSQWFLGDMTELVMRESRTITEDQIHDQRDAMFGIYPVKPEPARVTITSHEASVKGNKPRHMVIDFGSQINFGGTTTLDTDQQMFDVYDDMRYDIAEISVEQANLKSVFVGFPGWGTNAGDDTGLTQRFVYSARFKPGTVQQYTDEVTDNYRLLDLEKDVNMDDFDVISISNYPGSAAAWQIYEVVDSQNQEPKIPMRNQVENLMQQVKEQVIYNEKSLFINDPMSAVELGIVDRVDWVPSFVETATFDARLGAVAGRMDWHAYVIDPFNGGTPWVPYALQAGDGGKSAFTTVNRNRAARYMDLHSNIKQKVRNTVQGLTTIPGYILEDYIIWNNVNPMATPPEQQSMDWADRSAGMYIGDEFYMISEHDDNIPGGFAASPVSHVKVGKAVTTFAPIWYYTPSAEYMVEHPRFVDDPDNSGQKKRDADIAYGNPYYDHAVSIAVEPGDAWDGHAVTGKVYVNFTETFTHRADLWDEFDIFVRNGEQVPPLDGVITPRDEWPILVEGGIAIGQAVGIEGGGTWTITAEMMKYNYSTHYGHYTGSEIHMPDTGSGPDWGWSAGGSRSGGGGGNAYAMSHFWAPSFKMKSVDTPTMAQRAARWLISETRYTGASVNNVATATLAASANDVVVETEQNVYVDLSTARLEFESFSDADTISPDITVAVPTVSVVLSAHGVATDVNMDTASVFVFTGEPELQDYEVDWDNALALTMPMNTITLTLEDA